MPKFHRNPQPNRLYLCCVLYHEDKVLMTNEECLPILSVADEVPLLDVNIQNEFHWFCKLPLMWNDIDQLKQKFNHLDKRDGGGEGGPYSLRSKILNTISSMQDILSGLGGDLGNAYRMPIMLNDNSSKGHHHQGGDPSVIFCLVRHVRDPKSVVSLSLKWVPMSRAQKVGNQGSNNNNPPNIESTGVGGHMVMDHHSMTKGSSRMESLCFTIREQIIFQQVSEMSLSSGLYLCYVQASSTVDGALNVVVPNTSPSILPYIKVRDNAHVTSEEWGWLQQFQIRSHARSQGNSAAIKGPKTSAAFLNQHASPTTNFLGTGFKL